MEHRETNRLPSRSPGLIASEFAGDYVVVDPSTGQAHTLSGDVADVWRALEVGNRPDLPEARVDEIVGYLATLGLVDAGGISRRVLLKTGVVGGATLAAFGGVASMALPAAAMAGSTDFTAPGTYYINVAAGATFNYEIAGAGGGGGSGALGKAGADGGDGAYVAGTIKNTTTAASVLRLDVAGPGGGGQTGAGAVGSGFGAGGKGGANGGGGGGGATTISAGPSSAAVPLVVAGGGGGGGAGGSGSASSPTPGGHGGTTNTGDGTASLAYGGANGTGTGGGGGGGANGGTAGSGSTSTGGSGGGGGGSYVPGIAIGQSTPQTGTTVDGWYITVTAFNSSGGAGGAGGAGDSYGSTGTQGSANCYGTGITAASSY